MINGKTMANLRKIINVRLANNEKDFIKYASRLTHVTHKIFDKNYASTHEIRPVLRLNKPNYFLLTVLELSKWLMYDFHYNFIKKHFDAEFLFTGTDNLTYEIKSEDLSEEFFNHKHLFDFGNYPKDLKFFDETNKNIIGKTKEESEGKIIDVLVGLESKIFP